MLILEGNPVCANNSKETTKKMYKTSACVFPGISDKMNSVNVNEKNHYQATKLTHTHKRRLKNGLTMSNQAETNMFAA